MGFLVKWPLLAAGAGLVIKNIDILAPIAGVVGSFFYMCGLSKGGLIVRVTLAIYLLVKTIGW